MELVEPSAAYKDSFIDAVREYRGERGTETTRRYADLSVDELTADFGAFVERERSHAKGENLPTGYVPQIEYWLIEGKEYIGHAGIRLELNDHLRAIGGQIGYNIRPSKRRQGYGTSILELALREVRVLGLGRVLVTCDATNVASRRIIEKNGGELENEVPNPDTGVNKLRFWIE